MKSLLRAGLAFVAAAAALGTASPTMAVSHGRELGCGDTITSSTRLTVDLIDCPGAGLVIAADGIALDLNGHLVDGDASGGGVGVDVEGHRDVTIENGTVREFSEGVLVVGGGDIVIRHVASLREGHGGILVDGARDVTIAKNVVRRSGAGIIVTRSNRVRVARNHVSRSTFGGIPVFGSRHVVIVGNSVTRCRTDMGIGLVQGSSHSVVISNRVSRNGAGIVAADGAADNRIAGNTVRRNDSGVVVDVGTHDNRVVENLIGGSAFEGIAVVGSDGNVIKGNRRRPQRSGRSGRRDRRHSIARRRLARLLRRQPGRPERRAPKPRRRNPRRRVAHGEPRPREPGIPQLPAGHRRRAGDDRRGRNRAAHNGSARQCVGVSCVP